MRNFSPNSPTCSRCPESLFTFARNTQSGLADASSRPAHSPRAIEPAKALAIVELRHNRALGVSISTVGRVLARASLSRLADLRPAEPVVRYEHAAPGEMLHIYTKKLRRMSGPAIGHRQPARFSQWCRLGDAVRGY